MRHLNDIDTILPPLPPELEKEEPSPDRTEGDCDFDITVEDAVDDSELLLEVTGRYVIQHAVRDYYGQPTSSRGPKEIFYRVKVGPKKAMDSGVARRECKLEREQPQPSSGLGFGEGFDYDPTGSNSSTMEPMPTLDPHDSPQLCIEQPLKIETGEDNSEDEEDFDEMSGGASSGGGGGVLAIQTPLLPSTSGGPTGQQISRLKRKLERKCSTEPLKLPLMPIVPSSFEVYNLEPGIEYFVHECPPFKQVDLRRLFVEFFYAGNRTPEKVMDLFLQQYFLNCTEPRDAVKTFTLTTERGAKLPLRELPQGVLADLTNFLLAGLGYPRAPNSNEFEIMRGYNDWKARAIGCIIRILKKVRRMEFSDDVVIARRKSKAATQRGGPSTIISSSDF